MDVLSRVKSDKKTSRSQSKRIHQSNHPHSENNFLKQPPLTSELLHLDQLFAALPTGVIVLDERGQIQQFNLAAETLLTTPLKQQLWRDVIEQVFSPKPDDGHEISLKNGKRIHLTASVLEDTAQQVLFIEDRTETRALQDELRRAERLVSMGQMMSAMAHQIRTPLASALLYASHLSDFESSKASPQKKYAEKIKGRLKAIENQIQDILLFAKTGESITTAVNVEELLEEVVNNIQSEVNRTQTVIQLTNLTSHVELIGNRDALSGALQNLLVNAMQASKPKQVVTLSVLNQRNEVKFTVTDQGAGMDSMQLERVFEPFYTTKSNGTGLGLAVVKSVVELHGGELDIQSKKEVGTEISITLPCW